MGLKWPQSGAGNHAAYGVSGIPYATASIIEQNATLEVSFDHVTRHFHVVNDGTGDLRVGFSRNGVSGSGTNYFLVPNNTSSPRLEIRCREIFLFAQAGPVTASVCAGLTSVPRHDYFSVTGSQFVSGAIYLPNGVG